MKSEYLYPQGINFGYNDTIEKLQEEFDYVKKFIESYDDLSDFEKYKILTHFIYLRYNTHDIINLVNIKDQHNYTRLVDIPTKMETQFIESEGHGRDFSWWTKKVKLVLTCATHDTFGLEDTAYSYDKIIDLIEEKTIYPISSYGMEINKYSEDKEEIKNIKLFRHDVIDYSVDEYAYWNNRLIITPNEKNAGPIVKYLENNISKTKLFSFVKSYFKDLLAYLNEYRECASRKETEVFSEMMEYYNTYFKGKRLIKK